MSKQRLFVIPAALVPGAIFLLARVGAPDAMAGMVAGGLIGLSFVGFIRGRGCPAKG